MSLNRFSLLLPVFLWVVVVPQQAIAATPAGGSISVNTTWSAAGSPYIVNSSVTVDSGATLTVQAGTIVKFAAGTVLNVLGTLTSSGTDSTNMVTFTSINDGTDTPPVAGDWNGIQIYNGGNATFDFSVVRYGGGGSGFSNIYKTAAGTFAVRDSEVSYSAGYGIYVDNNTLPFTISGSTARFNGTDGAYLLNNSGAATLQNNTLADNGGYGLHLMAGTLATPVDGNSVSGNTLGALRLSANHLAPVFSGTSTYSGNIVIDDGTLAESFSLTAGTPYVVAATFSVGTAATLTVPAGTTVKFGQSSGINVYGTLSANGISGNMVYFTDLRDDSVGDDTNGDGPSSGVAGGWNGISVYSGGSASLTCISINYGSSGIIKDGTGTLSINNSTISNGSGAGVTIFNSTAVHSITGSTISSNGSDGIQLNGTSGAVAITGNIITGNGGYGVGINSSSKVTVATNTLTGNSAGAVQLAAENLSSVGTNATSGKFVINGGTVTQTTTLDASYSYVVASTLAVNAILNVPAGTIVRFAPGAGIDVNGTLNASGVAGNRVYFTDLRDDSVGGLSYGATGGWGGINVNSAGSATFDYAAIRYSTGNITGNGSGSITIRNSEISNASNYGIYLAPPGTMALTLSSSTVSSNGTDGIALSYNTGAMNISGNTISGNAGRGIFAEGSGTNPNIRNNVIARNAVGISAASGALPLIGGSDANANSIFQNSAFGAQNAGSVAVNATYNWWGGTTGPRHAGNPAGTGNAVSDYVTFSPYRTAATFSEAVATFVPEDHDFRHVAVGTASTPQLFTVTNSGSQPLVLGPVTVGGANPGGFSITADTCNSASIAPGVSCTVSVTFTPTAKQAYSARLEFPAGGATILPLYSVALSGRGISTLPFTDDFNGSISPDWSIINPAPTNYNLTTIPGSLAFSTILSATFDPATTTKNLFIIALPTGIEKLMVSAKVKVPESWHAQPQGGIILMPEKNSQADLDNYIRSQYVHVDRYTRSIQTATRTGGGAESALVGASPNIDGAWLRLVKRGASYQSLYSTDGITFTPWRTDTLQQETAYAGLFAFHQNKTTAASVSFDWFSVRALPTITAPASLAFGNVPLGSMPQQHITISNIGPGPLTVSTLTISGANSALFGADLGSCSSPVPAGGSCNLMVSMTTTTLGAFSASLAVGSDDIDTPTVTAALSGSVSAPVIIPIDFPATNTGSGTVRHAESGSVCNTNCSVISTAGAPATFTATPDEYSLFTVWGGSCSGGNPVFSFTTPGTTGRVTATFERKSAHSVKIEPDSYFPTILGAYGSAVTTGTTVIKVWGTNYSEPLLFDQGKDVQLEGGYDGAFSSNSGGMTTVQGTMTVKAKSGATGGKVDGKNITIKALP